MHVAAERGHADVLLFLIRLGNEANVDVVDRTDNCGRSALHEEVQKQLLKNQCHFRFKGVVVVF